MTKLTLVDYEYVMQYASAAAKEKVSVKPTKSPTLWFTDHDKPMKRHGFCGLIKIKPEAWRIKGVYVFPEYRGFGYGEAMTLALMDAAVELGAKSIEAIALNPAFYERHGYTIVAKIREGSWRVCKHYEI